MNMTKWLVIIIKNVQMAKELKLGPNKLNLLRKKTRLDMLDQLNKAGFIKR